MILDVELTDKPFGNGQAYVKAEGHYGYDLDKWYLWTDINTSPTTATVSLSLPGSEFPDNSDYRICVSSNELLAYTFPNCYSGVHSFENEAISVSLR